MSYGDRKRPLWHPWGGDQAEESIARRSMSQGKRTLTMSLPARPASIWPSMQERVQRKTDPVAAVQCKEDAALTAQWMDVAMRPDLCAAPTQQTSARTEHDEPSATPAPDLDLSSSAMAQRMSDIFGRAFQQTIIGETDQAPRETLSPNAQDCVDRLSPALDVSVHRGGAAGKALEAYRRPCARGSGCGA
jgi:hypothetical protein